MGLLIQLWILFALNRNKPTYCKDCCAQNGHCDWFHDQVDQTGHGSGAKRRKCRVD